MQTNLHGWASVEHAMDTYAQNIFEYQLGLEWMKPAVPVCLDKKQSAKVRQTVYKELRERFPERFPKGYRFH